MSLLPDYIILCAINCRIWVVEPLNTKRCSAETSGSNSNGSINTISKNTPPLQPYELSEFRKILFFACPNLREGGSQAIFVVLIFGTIQIESFGILPFEITVRPMSRRMSTTLCGSVYPY